MSRKKTPVSISEVASAKNWSAADSWILGGLFFVAALIAYRVIKAQPYLDDDAYIFLRYARNLLQYGQFAYNEGEFSYGFTSMLWLLLISGISGLTGISVMAGLKILSVLSFAAMIALMYVACLGLTGRRSASLAGTALLMLLPVSVEYSVSGMETPMVVCGLLAVIAMETSRKSGSAIWIGCAAGGLIWIRPELVLVFPVWMVVRLMQEMHGRLLNGLEGAGSHQTGRVQRDFLRSITGFTLIAAPYFGFWQIMNNRLIPMTYMGKLLSANPTWHDLSYTERILSGIRIFLRGWGNLITQDRVGTAVLLILASGLICGIPVFLQLQRKMFPKLTFSLLISVTIISAYWFSYPISHLRYGFWLLPVSLMVIVSTYSECVTLAQSIVPPGGYRLFRRIFRIVLPVLFCIVIGIETMTLIDGRTEKNQSFAGDVIVNNLEWFEKNIPKNQKVAFDMIGHFSYLLDRPIFDLGGLIHPQIWPALKKRRDANTALDILQESQVLYLVSYSKHILWAHLPQKAAHRLQLIDKRGDQKSGTIAIYRILSKPKEPLHSADTKAIGILMQSE
ncbi:hypothetical protein JXA80_03180 [bacterium]|nr:hypothetical protein [candidate division CSSED10-310 bacterium]